MTLEEELRAEIKRVRAIIKECEGTKVPGEMYAVKIMQDDIKKGKTAIKDEDQLRMTLYLSLLKKWKLINTL